MGPLASAQQLLDVRDGIGRLAEAAEIALGGPAAIAEKGFFVGPTLLIAQDAEAAVVHDLEVFGPVATVLPYDGTAARAAQLVGLGQGGLVASLFTDDPAWAREAVLGLAPWSGRVWVGGEKVAEHATSPGLVLPASIHGGPGRAGGGEELGGLRGLSLYLQRTAVQGYKGIVARAFGATHDTP
jgi:oxepin-CoA hydrolase/3-oxo-5,6-dehydrosuberyl-CoA semialdehyde dehydrogenase